MGSGRAGRPKTPHQIWPRTGRLCTDCRPGRRNNERFTKQLEKLYYKVHCSPTRKLCRKLTCNVNCLGTIGRARATTNKPENSCFLSVWVYCSLEYILFMSFLGAWMSYFSFHLSPRIYKANFSSYYLVISQAIELLRLNAVIINFLVFVRFHFPLVSL